MPVHNCLRSHDSCFLSNVYRALPSEYNNNKIIIVMILRGVTDRCVSDGLELIRVDRQTMRYSSFPPHMMSTSIVIIMVSKHELHGHRTKCQEQSSDCQVLQQTDAASPHCWRLRDRTYSTLVLLTRLTDRSYCNIIDKQRLTMLSHSVYRCEHQLTYVDIWQWHSRQNTSWHWHLQTTSTWRKCKTMNNMLL